MGSDSLSRRQFCARSCSAALLAALGVTLQGCGGGGSQSPASPDGVGIAFLPRVDGTVSGNTLTVGVGAGSVLAATGSVAFVQSAAGNVLVARTGPDSFTALSAVCTHEGCAITSYVGEVFVCPCHGARFDTSGQVVSGPAPTPLRHYTTELSGDVLTITG
jgi:cytochrome b6-f complex iron-sulfur subunit